MMTRHFDYFWIKYDLGQKCHAPQIRPTRGSNSWPPDHDSTFHVTEMPALTTWPSVTSVCLSASEGDNQSVWSSSLEVNRWLPPGNRTFLEVASMVIPWWIVGFFAQWTLKLYLNIYLESMSREDSHISRNTITELNLHNISNDEFLSVKVQLLAFTNTQCKLQNTIPLL